MRRASGTRKAGQIWLGEGGEAELTQLLAMARELQVSDVHILAGNPVLGRVNGKLVPMTPGPISASVARHLSCAPLGDRLRATIDEALDVDVMCTDADGHRYRIAVGFANGTVGAVIRLLPRRPIPLEELNLPPVVREMTERGKGLILVTGSTSQGKTTTMAAMVDLINKTSHKHIVTIEDPIEYVHEPDKALIRQREVGRDTKTFASGLRAALRQDPDVLLVGEMRDYETIDIALRAASSGVLVISTIHIVSLDRLTDRLAAYAPPDKVALVRTLMSEVLACAIHQELLPTLEGRKQVACEVLVGTRAVRNLLKSGTESGLRTALMSGGSSGMLTMQSSLDFLFDTGVISEEVRDDVMKNYAAVS
jgi:twitching motility protein PilT